MTVGFLLFFRLADDKANRAMSLTIELFEREESEVTCGIVGRTYGNVWQLMWR